jgi:hypothetical protein
MQACDRKPFGSKMLLLAILNTVRSHLMRGACFWRPRTIQVRFWNTWFLLNFFGFALFRTLRIKWVVINIIYIALFPIRIKCDRTLYYKTLLFLAQFRILAWARGFSVLHSINIESGTHLASYTIGTSNTFPSLKRQKREADHSPQSVAGVKNGEVMPPLSPKYSGRSDQQIKYKDNYNSITSVMWLINFFKYRQILRWIWRAYAESSIWLPC